MRVLPLLTVEYPDMCGSLRVTASPMEPDTTALMLAVNRPELFDRTVEPHSTSLVQRCGASSAAAADRVSPLSLNRTSFQPEAIVQRRRRGETP